MAVGINPNIETQSQAAAASAGIAAAESAGASIQGITEILIKWLPVLVVAAIGTILIFRK